VIFGKLMISGKLSQRAGVVLVFLGLRTDRHKPSLMLTPSGFA
jgi:hypothetical protein